MNDDDDNDKEWKFVHFFLSNNCIHQQETYILYILIIMITIMVIIFIKILLLFELYRRNFSVKLKELYIHLRDA